MEIPTVEELEDEIANEDQEGQDQEGQDPAPPQRKRSKIRNAAKQSTKVTWRIVQLGLSLWQIGDMVTDGLQTRKYWDLAIVSKKIAYL